MVLSPRLLLSACRTRNLHVAYGGKPRGPAIRLRVVFNDSIALTKSAVVGDLLALFVFNRVGAPGPDAGILLVGRGPVVYVDAGEKDVLAHGGWVDGFCWLLVFCEVGFLVVGGTSL